MNVSVLRELDAKKEYDEGDVLREEESGRFFFGDTGAEELCRQERVPVDSVSDSSNVSRACRRLSLKSNSKLGRFAEE
ncbi:unnamed protein product [Lasius platythorax]|uniref:Uncharacterized protein n=1 Tax=Lasius platythorax TaxID=488582 RepID=A0AAV2NRA1_9HYME